MDHKRFQPEQNIECNYVDIHSWGMLLPSCIGTQRYPVTSATVKCLHTVSSRLPVD